MIKPILTCDSGKTSCGHLEEKLVCETEKNNVANRTDAVSKNRSRNKCTFGSLEDLIKCSNQSPEGTKGPWNPISAQAWASCPCLSCLSPVLPGTWSPWTCAAVLSPVLSSDPASAAPEKNPWMAAGPGSPLCPAWACRWAHLSAPTSACCVQVLRSMPSSVRAWHGLGHYLLPAHFIYEQPVLTAPRLFKTGWFFFLFPGFHKFLCDVYIILRERQKAECKHIKNAQYSRERQSNSYWDLEPVCDNTVPGKLEADERENQDNPLNC